MSATERRRHTDTGWRRLIRENVYRDVWLLIITVVVGFALVSFEHESHARRDQTCKLFEKAEADAVTRLARTYDYVGRLSPAEMRQGFNPAIIVQVPQIERDARTAAAPPYCNEPGVGLPEPETKPKLPQRPPNLEALFRRQAAHRP